MIAGRRSRGRLRLALVAATLGTSLAGSATLADGPLAPPLPAQPGTQSATCTPTRGTPGAWTPVIQEAMVPPGGFIDLYTFPSYQVGVDPWMPCRLYRWTDAQTLQRSVDSGASWEVVFHDDAALTPATPQFSASAFLLPAPNTLVAGEAGNGDAAVRSDDAGATWQLSGGGRLAGQPLYALDAAPSDPQVIYASVVSSACEDHPPSNGVPFVGGCPKAAGTGLNRTTAAALGLFVSRDGGRTWNPGTLPATADLLGLRGPYRPYQLRVDPAAPGHLWVMVDSGPQAGPLGGAVSSPVPLAAPTVIFESADYGQTWRLAATLAGGCTELLVTRDAHHGLRLFAVLFDATNQVQVSSDDGSTWHALPLPLLNYGVLAVDPADAGRMLWVGDDLQVVRTIHADYSSDGMDSFRPVGDLSVPPAYVTTLMATSPLQPDSYGGSFDPAVVVQADRAGNFYVNTDSDCHVELCAANGRSEPYSTWTAHDFWRLTPPLPVQAAAAAATHVSPLPRSSTCGPLASCSPGQPLVELRHCPVPSTTLPYNGSLAFDGVELLYTQYQESGPRPAQGLIHRMTPACTGAGSIVVDFAQADLDAAAQRAQDQSIATAPVVDEMTYDPRRNQLWLSLATHAATSSSAFTEPAIVPLFSISLDHLTVGATETHATYRFDGVHCRIPFGGEELFAYDYSTDSLWTCDPRVRHQVDGIPFAAFDPGRRAAADGTPQDTCMSGVETPDNMATWVVGGLGHIYVQDEDDTSIYEYDSQTCALENIYRHRPFAEAQGEDEQMACDGVTFASGIAGGGAGAGAAIWLRDATAEVMTAYAIADGTCPLPTTLQYSGTPVVPVGGAATMCATLSLRGQARTLAGEPLEFFVDGAIRGAATTDARGLACVTRPIDVPGSNAVRVDYGGSRQYLPSSADGTVLATALAGGHSQPPFKATGAPPAAGSPIGQLPPNANAVSGSRQASQATQGQLQPQSAPQGQGAPVGSGSSQTEQQIAAAAALAAAGLAPDAEGATQYQMRAVDAPVGPLAAGLLAAAGALAAVLRASERLALSRSRRAPSAPPRRRCRPRRRAYRPGAAGR